jgi:hypothetical protein
VVAVRENGDRSLAQGVVVDTRIVARLFRIPILRLDGIVLLTPTPSVEPSLPPVVSSAVFSDGSSEGSSAGSSGAARVQPVSLRTDGAIGNDLDEVARTLGRLRNGRSGQQRN